MRLAIKTALAIILFSSPVLADTINHIEVSANFYNYESFSGSFDWNVTTQSVASFQPMLLTGNLIAVLPFWGTIGNNFAAWGGFQIDIRQYQAFNHITFNDEGAYNGSNGGAALAFYGQVPGVPWTQLGGWNGLTGTMTITDPVAGEPAVPTPEPQTWFLICAGIAAVIIAFTLKRR